MKWDGVGGRAGGKWFDKMEYMHHELNDEIRYSIILPDTPIIIIFVFLFSLFFILFWIHRSCASLWQLMRLDCSWQIDNQSILCGNIVYHIRITCICREIGSILGCASHYTNNWNWILNVLCYIATDKSFNVTFQLLCMSAPLFPQLH